MLCIVFADEGMIKMNRVEFVFTDKHQLEDLAGHDKQNNFWSFCTSRSYLYVGLNVSCYLFFVSVQ